MRLLLHFLVLGAVAAQAHAHARDQEDDDTLSSADVGAAEVYTVGNMGGNGLVTATGEVAVHISEGTLYEIKATPFTDQVGIGELNNIESLYEWGRRLTFVWYYANVCPCNFGCDEKCSWCLKDTRYPDWWPIYRRRHNRTTSMAETVEGGYWGEGTEGAEGYGFGADAEQEGLPADAEEYGFAAGGDASVTEGYGLPADATTTDNWGELFKCNHDYQDIHTSIGPVAVDKSASSVKCVTTYLHHRVMGSIGLSTRGSDLFSSTWKHPEAYLMHLVLYSFNDLRVGFQLTHDPNEEASYIPITPSGVEEGVVFWPMKINQYEQDHAVNSFIKITLRPGIVFVPRGTDVLAWFDTIAQRIEGHVYADVALVDAQTLERNLTYDFRLGTYHISLHSDHAQGMPPFYHEVSEFECGPPTDPPVCRTHTQSGGQVVQRVYGDWRGLVAPYINKTVYEWNVDWEHEDPSKTDWDLRHDCKILSVTRLQLNVDYDIEYLAISDSPPEDIDASSSTEDEGDDTEGDAESSTQAEGGYTDAEDGYTDAEDCTEAEGCTDAEDRTGGATDPRTEEEEEEMNLVTDIPLEDLYVNPDLYDMNSFAGDIIIAIDDWRYYKLY